MGGLSLLGLLVSALPLMGCAECSGTAGGRGEWPAVARDDDAPLLFEGYCPSCEVLAVAAERAPGVPATPLVCATCEAALGLPVIVIRRTDLAG